MPLDLSLCLVKAHYVSFSLKGLTHGAGILYVECITTHLSELGTDI